MCLKLVNQICCTMLSQMSRRLLCLASWIVAEGSSSWCQAVEGSCVGQLHGLQERSLPAELLGWHQPERNGKAIETNPNLFGFGDWDGDGDQDLLLAYAYVLDSKSVGYWFLGEKKNLYSHQIEFYEQLSNGTFQIHQLAELRTEGLHNSIRSLAVVDYDGDQKLDLLLCSRDEHDVMRVSLLNHSMLPLRGLAQVESLDHIFRWLPLTTSCDGMQAVDFDEDGQVELFLRLNTLESSAEIVQFPGYSPPTYFGHPSLHLLVDIDGDGRLEMIKERGLSAPDFPFPWSTRSVIRTRFNALHRAGDGSFVEPAENPLANLELNEGERLHFTDWNSDRLLDVLVVEVGKLDDSDELHNKAYSKWRVREYYQHVLHSDLGHNQQMTGYEDIEHTGLGLQVLDWNQDGWEDVVTKVPAEKGLSARLHLYQFDGQNVMEVNVPFQITTSWESMISVIDWDGDGDWEVLESNPFDGKVGYYSLASGSFKEGPNPFSNVSFGPDPHYGNLYAAATILPVDWDNDGDLDLVLMDGRYYEQLADGTLQLAEDSPFEQVDRNFNDIKRRDKTWLFLDCDLDGDLDLLRVLQSSLHHVDRPVQACEHDSVAHVVRCDYDFLCLGTNLSNFRLQEGGPFEAFGAVQAMGLGHVADGRLRLIGSHRYKKGAVLWTAGFCVPKNPCHHKGLCLPRQQNCTCIRGHELGDCSRCESNFHGILQEFGQVRTCRECPGAEGKVCHDRGHCFDDASAQDESWFWATVAPAGNGSCGCKEANFHGSDDDGRSTCVEGSCPNGTQEEDGRCQPCDIGSVSVAGGPCRKCGPGKYSAYSETWSSCSSCPAGTFSDAAGASACVACAAGTHSGPGSTGCQPCPPGFASSGGNESCVPCQPGFAAPKLGSSTCDLCAAGTFSEEASASCFPCPYGRTSGKASGTCILCDPGRVPNNDSSSCVPCRAGTIASPGSTECTPCRPGFISSPGSQSCLRCPVGSTAHKSGSACTYCPPGTYSEESSGRCLDCPLGSFGQNCEYHTFEVVLAVISFFSSVCFGFLCLMGYAGRVPIADVSSQGDKVVMTTALSHHLLKRPCSATFSGTGVPGLDKVWKVKALSSFQLTLQGDVTIPLDTSMGYVRMNSPFLHTGVWRCPLICWCLLFGVGAAGPALRLTALLALVVCVIGLSLGFLAFLWRRRQGGRTPLSKRRRQFLKDWPLLLERCERGPNRSMTAGQLEDFMQFFDAFIKERSMYYVCENIVKPLTEPYQLSFVELVGSTPMEWFVSHYWGMAARHFNDAVRRHAQSYQDNWRGVAYWICTFSNSQWHVRDELGNGEWQESSFYLALTSPGCKGTAMVLDERVLPLTRIWCLFEVYHTIRLSEAGNFQGLLLCTSTGVLQEGQAGTDVAVAVAKKAAELDTRGAEASVEEDRRMIHELIEQMPGGFDRMNSFVRDTICYALQASHIHYERTFKGLMSELTSSVASEPLPSLLTSPCESRQGKRANFVEYVGQERP